jgi:membrane protease YdiL (CAAX protease family)
VLLAVFVAAGGMTIALQSGLRGSASSWLVMGGVYLALAAVAAHDLHRRGLLADHFRIRPGDTSIGIVVGLVLCAGGALAQRMLAVEGSQGATWLADVHRFGGNFQTNGVLIFVLFVICVAEETVWRGMVQDQLARSNARLAPALTAVAYALSTTPSLLLLSGSSINPLLVLAALGTGVVWSYARRAVPRLFPLIVSHLVFTYFMAAPLPTWIVPPG